MKTIDEIKDLIAQKITGQGNQVDVGNGLTTILNGIVDAVKVNVPANITVKVHAYKVDGDESGFEPNAGATGKVIVKGFNELGETLPVQEIDITLDEEGLAEIQFVANVGDTIGVMAKIADSGASCQMVQRVVGDVLIPLESYPVGIWEIGDGSINYTPGDDMFSGAAIVSEDFALALPPHQRANWDTEFIPWGGMFQKIPFVMKAASDTEAITDFDGALNTAAILSVVKDGNCAALIGSVMPEPHYSRINAFLPSAGMLKYLYDHKAEINAFIAAETEAYGPDVDYELLGDQYCWSSTDRVPALSAGYAAYAWIGGLYDGYVNITSRCSYYQVLSVSAFQTIY